MQTTSNGFAQMRDAVRLRMFRLDVLDLAAYMLVQEAASIAHVAKETGLTRHTVYRGAYLTDFTTAEMHALKKALAIAIAVLEQRPRDVQGFASLAEMKSAFDQLVETDIDREMYARQARVALTGAAD